ncbi:hypothetical protein [Halopseudomonas pertucinogena]|uniref:Uncharacterized protein n=1 Tax=Halopseudomonas pertucinogena TaxID=86175 RepID=A0ABQ2CS31_9GAMM|nr:hypothetical protein [Halopseudomonas pertucinogena]GGJ07347.1 hypothetical protein GCM10009083_25450 [Halopseudomonas pertucinogena]
MVCHINNPAHPLSQRLAQALDGYPLQADRSTGAALMCMPEVEQHTEHYIAIEHGDSAHRGMLSGALGGMCSFFFGVFAVIFLLDNDLGTALMYFLIAVVCFVPSFLWEILRPMPLPILFNRRTREVYFEQEGQLYHSPWDGIAAAAYSAETVGPYTGRMGHAALEALLHRYGHPEEQVLINLGSPLGKSLPMQLGFWEYLRAYMNNGPWFDEQGNPTDSRSFNLGMLDVHQTKGQMVRLYWGLIRKEYEANNGRNFLKGAHVILLLGGIFFLPFHAVQNFTYAIAKRRSRSRWPELIRERLEPDGPTTRLVDLEQQQGG